LSWQNYDVITFSGNMKCTLGVKNRDFITHYVAISRKQYCGHSYCRLLTGSHIWSIWLCHFL